MNFSEDSEDQVDPMTTEDTAQDTDLTTPPMVEHAAVSRIAVLDPS